MIDLYARDIARAITFYSGSGFAETVRTPALAKNDRLLVSIRIRDCCNA
jgi:hypothetical protein